MTSLLPDNFTFTQSSLQTFVNCKYQFYLRYIEHFLWPAPATNDMLAFERDRSAGARFHQLVHQLLLGIPAESLVRSAENDPDARVCRWFELFRKSVYPRLSGELHPEYSLTVSLGGFSLSAKYDLLQVDAEHLTIYDWKTSKKKPARAWLEAQLQSKVFPLVLAEEYKLLERAPAPAVRMLYWEVSEPDEPFVLTCGADRLAEDREFVLSLMANISTSRPPDFLRTDDVQRCRFCVYRSYCNRPGLAVSPEEYLSETYLFNEDEDTLLYED